MVVPSGAAKEAVYALMNRTMEVKEVRDYLAEQRLLDSLVDTKTYGYVDFDHLKKGKPTIVGDFYQDTRIGRLLSGGR